MKEASGKLSPDQPLSGEREAAVYESDSFFDENSGTSEVVAIDWSGIGPGPIETNIGTMVGGSLTWGNEEANLIIEGESEIFEFYLDGIKSSGPNRSETDARIGYAYAAGGYGMFFPATQMILEQDLFGPEFLLGRYGVDPHRVEVTRNERLEFTADFIEEAVSLL